MSSNGLFVGLTTLDIHYQLDEHPAPNTKNKAKSHQLHAGGPATNAAVCFAFLGGQATLCAAVGKHLLSDIIHRELSAYNVELVDLTPDHHGLPNLASIFTTSIDGNRTIIYNQPDKVMVSLAVYKKIDIEKYDFVMVDGSHIDACVELARIAKNHEKTVIFDGGSWKDKTEQLLPFVDIAICSDDFLPPGCTTKEETFDYLVNFKIQHIAITRGGRNILYQSNGVAGEINVEDVEALDTLAAGDVLHGSFCLFYMQTKSFTAALQEAANVATFSCNYFGSRAWMNDYAQEHLQTT